jgi:hypothetical protein
LAQRAVEAVSPTHPMGHVFIEANVPVALQVTRVVSLVQTEPFGAQRLQLFPSGAQPAGPQSIINT